MQSYQAQLVTWFFWLLTSLGDHQDHLMVVVQGQSQKGVSTFLFCTTVMLAYMAVHCRFQRRYPLFALGGAEIKNYSTIVFHYFGSGE